MNTHKHISQIDREDLSKLEQKARDLGFAIIGREIGEQAGRPARVKLHLEAKGYGADKAQPERDF